MIYDEVIEMFNWYQQESGQLIKPEVVERLWYELNVASSVTSFQGQPGLTCWFGELLTETYNQVTHQPITMAQFEDVYAAALDLLLNNNICSKPDPKLNLFMMIPLLIFRHYRK
ncbi:MAG: hypothetical protein ABFS56_26725 [Pseudomonadota bacterium]